MGMVPDKPHHSSSGTQMSGEWLEGAGSAASPLGFGLVGSRR